MKVIKALSIIVLSLLFYSCTSIVGENLFIRLNQVGFLSEDHKTAIVISQNPFVEKFFFVKDSDSNHLILSDSIKILPFKLNSAFSFSALLDFSKLNSSGNYYLEFQGNKSFPFRISSRVFNSVRDSLSLFFKVQRCGPTYPVLHNVCHLQDATKVIGYSDSSSIDLTGGWHDAGDYIKFLYTTAFTTYMLLFSYEFSPEKFSFDLNNNLVPDILEEARVGLDFLLRCSFADNAFISQVQNDNDHNVGWRLPENDTLTFNRPAFVKMNKSQIGIYCAALSLASRIWEQKFFDYDFSKKCLNTAKKIFNLRNSIQDFVDDEKYYSSKEFFSKLALGAIEIYRTTNDEEYLSIAYDYGRQIPESKWWSWGDINPLIYFRLAEFEPEYINKLKLILQNWKSVSDSNLFSESHNYNWGTTHSFAGVVLTAILYERITNSFDFRPLATFNRDFILGRNAWGMSFIYNIGKKFPEKIHHQVGYFNNGYIPGAMVSGPVPDSLMKKNDFNIVPEFLKSFSSSAVYSDDFENYLTNEPTISANATALFIFGYYSN